MVWWHNQFFLFWSKEDARVTTSLFVGGNYFNTPNTFYTPKHQPRILLAWITQPSPQHRTPRRYKASTKNPSRVSLGRCNEIWLGRNKCSHYLHRILSHRRNNLPIPRISDNRFFSAPPRFPLSKLWVFISFFIHRVLVDPHQHR